MNVATDVISSDSMVLFHGKVLFCEIIVTTEVLYTY